MTQLYEKPKLTIHGRVEELTQAQGFEDQSDSTIFNGATLPNNLVADPNGSRDFFQNDGGPTGFQSGTS